jgi:Fe-S cluster biogenesis protein NfuA
MLILWEATPNPDALKFVPGRDLTLGQGRSFRRESDTGASPLADRLFEIPGVARVHVGSDFVTVIRQAAGPGWPELRGAIILALADHLASGAPHVAADAPAASEPSGIEGEIADVLERFVRPAVSRDGGEIVLQRFDPASGVAWIRMDGACGGCPSSRQTLKATVEQTVRRYVPEVAAVDVEPSDPTAHRRGLPAWWAQRRPAGDAPRRPAFTHNGRAFSRRDP